MQDREDELLDDEDSLADIIKGQKKKSPPNQAAGAPSPEKGSPDPEPPRGGDFSALMKKLGMTRKQEPAPVEAAPVGSVIGQPQQDGEPEAAVTSLEDLLEDEEETPHQEPAGVHALEQIESATPEQDTGEGGNQETPVQAPSAEEPAPPSQKKAPVIEILDEDPREALRKAKAARKIRLATEEPPETGNDAIADEKIITVDQISDLSGLIMPKGATFEVEELRLHSTMSGFAGTGRTTLPPEFDEIWKREFSTAGFKDLDIEGELATGMAPVKPEAGRFGLASLFKAIRSEQEEYDPVKHGPLVDLSFHPPAGLEEMEMYPVNEPYAYIRITYDHSTHEYTYHVIEPELTDAEKDLLKELKERLFETLDINTKDITADEAKKKLRDACDDIIQDFGIRLTPVQREKIHYNMHKDFLGDGLIDPIMHDKYIEDISCDGINTPIFAFHASYESMKSTLAYHNPEELDSFVTKLAQRAGKYISIAEPILDATMQDGSRIQMTLGTEVTAHGSTFTIRKFKDEPITPTDLIEWHTFSPLAIAYIWLAVEGGKSAIFAGGTASGKTTALNAISLFIPPMAKIVSLEDTREVKLPHPNWIPSVTRDSFDTAGRGEINMYELLRAAMRQRPEYIIVGEVRGKECQTLFQAMSTGHITYSTTHADSVASVVHRIENPPMDVPRNMLSALDFICIQVQARVGGKRIRRNKQIVEVLDIDPRTNELITNEVFKWRSATDEHSYSGKSYLLEELMEARGWNEGRMREELKRRQEVLEWMRIKKIRHYKDVSKILISYHRDPEAVIERVRKDLYE